MSDLIPHHSSPTPAPAPAGASQQPAVPDGPLRAHWTRHVDRLGWEVMPLPALRLLADAGLCALQPVASWATKAGVRNRGPAGYTHDIEGWWIDQRVFLTVQARRPVAPEQPGSRRFRPTGGPWVASVQVHPLTVSDIATQRWNRPPGGGAAADAAVAASAGYTSAPWEILPAAIRQRLGPRPTQHGAARRYPETGGLLEQIVAYHRAGEHLIAVGAERRGGAWPDPETALDSAAWHTTVLEATVGAPTTLELPAHAPQGTTDDQRRSWRRRLTGKQG